MVGFHPCGRGAPHGAPPGVIATAPGGARGGPPQAARVVACRFQAPGSPPPLVRFPRGRQRPGDPLSPVCPAPACASQGWRGRGHLRAHGRPVASPGGSGRGAPVMETSPHPTGRSCLATTPRGQRRGTRPAPGAVPGLASLCLAPCQPYAEPVPTHGRGLGHGVATVDVSAGGGIARARVEFESGAAVPRATGAPAADGPKKRWAVCIGAVSGQGGARSKPTGLDEVWKTCTACA
jgi:hypothetical protein